MYEGENLLSMSHSVFGKYAVGVPHASVLIELELMPPASDGTSPPLRGQNQILMNVGVRSIAYLHTGWKVSSSHLTGRSERGAGQLHAPSAAIVVELGSIVVGGIGVHATTGIAVGIRIAV